MKKGLRWVPFILVVLFAVAFMPSFASILFALVAALIIPVTALQRLFDENEMRGWVKGGLIAVLTVGALAAAPLKGYRTPVGIVITACVAAVVILALWAKRRFTEKSSLREDHEQPLPEAPTQPTKVPRPSEADTDAEQTGSKTIRGTVESNRINPRNHSLVIGVHDYCVVDTETTGLSKDSDKLVEVAIIKYKNDEIIDEYVSLVNPEKSISAQASAINGIKNADVANAPKYAEIAPRIAEMLADTVVIGHNVTFDLAFISSMLEEQGQNLSIRCIDTLALARDVIPGMPDYKLQTLLAQLSIDPGSAHRADSDALATAELFRYCRDTLSNAAREARMQQQAERKRQDTLRREKFARSPLLDTSFVFTGDFDIEREDIEQMARDVGAVVRGSISSKTDYVVVGDLAGYGGSTQKSRDAEEVIRKGGKLKKITEAEFAAMIEEASPLVKR